METSCQNIPCGIGREDLECSLLLGGVDSPLHGEFRRANTNIVLLCLRALIMGASEETPQQSIGKTFR